MHEKHDKYEAKQEAPKANIRDVIFLCVEDEHETPRATKFVKEKFGDSVKVSPHVLVDRLTDTHALGAVYTDYNGELKTTNLVPIKDHWDPGDEGSVVVRSLLETIGKQCVPANPRYDSDRRVLRLKYV